MNKFCVYSHDIDDVIFYVGKGKNYRPFDTLGRSDIWKSYVQKNGGEFNVNIIRWYKNEKKAFSAEKKLIAKHKPKCNINGNLLRNVLISKQYSEKSLSKHISQTGKSVTDYAVAAGLSHSVIYHALNGEFSHKTALKIYHYSDKKVKLRIKPIQFD